MISQNINILLADDDKADCLLFKEALEELPVSENLNIEYNAEQLIDELTKKRKQAAGRSAAGGRKVYEYRRFNNNFG